MERTTFTSQQDKISYMRKFVICFSSFLLVNLLFSPGNKVFGQFVYKSISQVLDSIWHDSLFEQYVVNKTKDTVFSFQCNKDTVYIDKGVFFVYKNKFWTCNYFDGNIKEKGKFKKRRYRGLFRMPIKYFENWENRYLLWENKKYYSVIKVGRWDYFDQKGVLVKYKIFSRDGFDMTPLDKIE
jgi:hypothetical protein